jgi:hypothetical protein
VRLTVTDPLGLTGTTGLTVSLNNTPPVVQITSPPDGVTYQVCRNTTIPLAATISDAEHGPAELACAWQTILHHNNHVHPEPLDPNCATSTVLSPHGGQNETYYYEVVLTVSDAAGLSTTVSSLAYARCCPADWDGSGAVNSQDFFDFLVSFFGGNADFNGDGQTNSQDYFDFLQAFFTGC